MILTFEDKSFKLDSKTELKNEKGEIVYTCIYDFSYKKRIRILDKSNNEIAYIQFKILSSIDQITLYDKQDKQLAYIKQNSEVIEDDGLRCIGNYDNYKIVDKNNNEIMVLANNTVNISDDNYILKCIMCLYVFANKEELIV